MANFLLCIVVLIMSVINCTNPNNPMQMSGGIFGFAYDATDSIPIAGVSIFLAGDSVQTVTDSAGHFQFTDIASGEQIFTFEKTHYFACSETVLVQTSALSRADTIYLSRDYGVLAGMVYDAKTGDPVPQAEIKIHAAYHGIADSTTTDSTGHFMFDYAAVDTGGYTVSICKSGFQDVLFAHRVVAGDSVFVTKGIYPYIQKTYVVYDVDTQLPLEEATLCYDSIESKSNAQGVATARVPEVPDTVYQVRISRQYFGTQTFCDTIKSNEPLLDSIPMQRLTGNLQGFFRLQGQNDYSGIVVQFNSLGLTDTTDSLGRISISNVPAGIISFTASKQNYSSVDDSVGITGLGMDFFELDLSIRSGVIRARVDWFAEFSPYLIENHLEVAEGGTLNVHAGVEIQMANDSELLTAGNGFVKTIGDRSNLIRISSDSSSNHNAKLKIWGVVQGPVLKYTMIKDVETVFRNDPIVEHCLFVHTQNFGLDTCMHILPSGNDVGGDTANAARYPGARFNQCDFVRIGSSAMAIFVHDSMFDASEPMDTVVFSKCIFSQFSNPTGNTPFLESDNVGNICTRLLNCNLYADGTVPNPLYNITHIDTSQIWQVEPGYINETGFDFHLQDTSLLLDKEINPDYMNTNYIGALGSSLP